MAAWASASLFACPVTRAMATRAQNIRSAAGKKCGAGHRFDPQGADLVTNHGFCRVPGEQLLPLGSLGPGKEEQPTRKRRDPEMTPAPLW